MPEKRGFIREGYFADIVLIDTKKSHNVSKDSLLYKCNWSPFEGQTFDSSIFMTFVNGKVVYDQGSELTIASGVITVTHSYHKIDTEGDAGSDD